MPLKDGISPHTAVEGESACETCGAKLLTASGTVNGEPVNMEDGNAIVPLMVINNPGFDLPKTGGYGTVDVHRGRLYAAGRGAVYCDPWPEAQ